MPSSPAEVATSHVFDPTDQAFFADPGPSLDRLRDEAPVFHDTDRDVWWVSRYATCRSILTNTERFSSANVLDPLRPPCAEAVAILVAGGVSFPPLLANNHGPDHKVQRRFLGAPFQRSRISNLVPMVAEVVATHVDAVAGLDRFDLVRELAWPIPLRVLYRFLGIPDTDVDTLKRWSGSRLQLVWGDPGPEDQVRLARELVEFMAYAREFVAAKEREPGDDYTSDLIRAVADEPRDHAVVRDQLVVNTFNLLSAGHETTANLMANAIHLLLSERSRWEALVADPGSAAAVVEESLRLAPSIMTWRRRALVDVELDGVTVPAGATVFLSFAAANRDPEQFGDPAVFEAGRANAADHLSFGFGVHRCLGAQLAQMEVGELLRRLSEAAPDLELVDAVPTYVPNLAMRAPDGLLVRRGGSADRSA